MASKIELLTVDEFARRLGVSRSTVFAWLSKGYLPEGKLVIRIGRTIRFVWSLEALALIQHSDSVAGGNDAPDFTSGKKRSQVNLDY